jgi:hypothetical protein
LGHYLANIFCMAALSIRKAQGNANYSLMLRWTAGHINIEGNEAADKEVKLAVDGTNSPPESLPRILKKPLKYNKSAAKQCHKTKLKNTWNNDWQQLLCMHRLKIIDPSLPLSNFLKIISKQDITRQGASWLFQIQIRHFLLNTYLHRFKQMVGTNCPACDFHSETAQHFLLDCPIYAHKRWPLLRGKRPNDEEYTRVI